MSFRIVTNPASVRLGKLGPSTGELWVVFDDKAFPAQRWNDFAVVILTAWVTAMIRIVRGASVFERVHFMDGPYAIEIAPSREGEVELRGVARGATEKAHAQLRSSVLVANLLEAGDGIVAQCRAIGDQSSDLRQLETVLRDARAELAKTVS